MRAGLACAAIIAGVSFALPALAQVSPDSGQSATPDPQATPGFTPPPDGTAPEINGDPFTALDQQRAFGDDGAFGLPTVVAFFGRGLAGSADADVDYESNIIRAGTVQPRDSRLSKADVRFRPALEGRFGLPFGRQQFFVTANVGYDFYGKDTILNREHIDVAGGVAYRLGPCAGQATGDYSRRQSSLADLTVVVSNLQSREDYSVNAACRVGVGLKPTLTVSRLVIDNNLIQRQTANIRAWTYRGSIDYDTPVLGTVSLFASDAVYSYPRSSRVTAFDTVQVANPTPPPATIGQEQATATATDGVSVLNVGGTYSRAFGTRIQGSVSVFAVRASPSLKQFFTLSPLTHLYTPGSNPTSNSIGYAISAGYKASARLGARLELARNVTPPLGGVATYYISTSSALEINYRLNARISPFLDASLTSRQYQGTPLVTDATTPLPRGTDDLYRVSAGSSYRLGRRILLSGSGLFVHRGSQTRGFGFSSFGGNLNVRVIL